MARILTVTSGKGGVGKTSICLNLALELAYAGHRVCLFDGDLGLANISILTGLQPEDNLESVLDGRLCIEDILIRNYQGIDIIPGSSGVQRLADLNEVQTRTLIDEFVRLEGYDFFLIDTSAGISATVLALCMASHEILLVITPEPTSLTDAYAMLKLLSLNNYQYTVHTVVNQVTNRKEAQKVYSQLKDTVVRFLSITIQPLGIVVKDRHVGMAVVAQTPFTLVFPDSNASRCLQAISRQLADFRPATVQIPLEQFWEHCLGYLTTVSPATRKPDPAPQTGTSTDSTATDIPGLLARIEQGIQNLASDLAAVRQLIDRPAPPEPAKMPLDRPIDIRLDFEAWLDRTGSRN